MSCQKCVVRHRRKATRSRKKPRRFTTTSKPDQITKLPPEILSMILNTAITDDTWKYRAHRISWVCKAFNRCIQPLLFNDISLIGHSIAPACKRVRHLYKLITADSSPVRFCKSLIFSLRENLNPIPADYVLGTRLLTSLSEVQILEIYGGFGHELTWLFLKEVLRSMHCLKSVTLVGHSSNALLPNINAWDCIKDLKTQRLELRGIGPCRDGSTWNISKVSEQ